VQVSLAERQKMIASGKKRKIQNWLKGSDIIIKKFWLKRLELVAPPHVCPYHLDANTWLTDAQYISEIGHIYGSCIGAVLHRPAAFKQFVYNM